MRTNSRKNGRRTNGAGRVRRIKGNPALKRQAKALSSPFRPVMGSDPAGGSPDPIRPARMDKA